jgi:predicted TIM-barrel fold metal-dependent hydrolase
MIFDCHNHIGYDPVYQRNRSVDELIVEMDANNVEKAVIFPFTNNPDVVNQNKIIQEAIGAYPDRFTGFFTMNPKLTEMTDLMTEYRELGFKGVVVDQRFGPGFGDRRIHELVECAYVLGLVVWIHSDQKDSPIGIGSLEGLIQKYSGVKYILSSMFRDAFYVATKLRNVYIDTSVFELSQDLTKLIRPIGAHRILVGSNTSYGAMRGEINKIQISPELTRFQKELILGKNLSLLFHR